MGPMIRALLVSLLASPAFAGTWDPLTSTNWEEAQRAGGVVLIEFSAAGCKICGVQKGVLKRLLADDPDLAVTGLQVSLGADPDLEKRFIVKTPGTILLLRGGRELARAVGTCSEDELRNFIQQAFILKRWGAPKGRPSNRIPQAP